MKKKYVLLIILLIISIITVLLIKNPKEKMPFKDIHMDDVKSVTATLQPPNVTYELNTKEIEELIKILQSVVIYNKDNSYRNYCGQSVIFSIVKNHGSTIDIMAYSPFLVIDGTGYKTKYELCDKLSSLGNRIVKSGF